MYINIGGIVMSMTIDLAIKCFLENRDLFGNPQSQPEKYNLYNGLANLAQGISDMETEMKRLQQKIQLLTSYRKG